MRISDWSSDVCSSDLSYVPGGDANPAARADFHCPSFLRSYVDKTGNTHGRGLLQFAKPRKLHGSAVIRINLHIIGRLEKHTEFRCEAVEIRLAAALRSEEHTSELQSLMRISYAVSCLKKKNKQVRKT